jgi:hypothetical protein
MGYNDSDPIHIHEHQTHHTLLSVSARFSKPCLDGWTSMRLKPFPAPLSTMGNSSSHAENSMVIVVGARARYMHLAVTVDATPH